MEYKLLEENYSQEKNGYLKRNHDAFGNKLVPEKGYRLLKRNEVVRESDKVFDIYSGWCSGLLEYDAQNGHHANFNGGRWTAWERKIKKRKKLKKQNNGISIIKNIHLCD